MMKKELVIVTIHITNAGQIKHFQVKLPKNTSHIIGVQHGVRWLGNVTAAKKIPMPASNFFNQVTASCSIYFYRNILLGDVKLQSCEKANVFYAGDVQLDRNMGFGVFAQLPDAQPNEFTHQLIPIMEPVVADGTSTIVQGVYKDRYGVLTQNQVNYKVQVYLWTAVH